MMRAVPWLLVLSACPGTEPVSESEGSAGASLSGAESDSAPPSDAVARPVATQLHLHGAISEGSGNYGFQHEQAQRWEVDALWWTDHAAMYEVARETSAPLWDTLDDVEDFAFSDAQQGIDAPERDQWWSFARQSPLELSYGLVADSGPEGTQVALEIEGINTTSEATLWADASWTAVRAGLYRPLLARPTLRLWLWLPEDYDAAAHSVRLLVPMSMVDPDVQVQLAVVDAADPVTVGKLGETTPTDRSVLPYGTVLQHHNWLAGTWNEVVLELATLDTPYGLDLTAQGLRVDLGLRGKGAFGLKLAGVELTHEVEGEALLLAQAALLEELSATGPVVHWAGQELGFEKTGEAHHHLTAFTPETSFLLGLEDLMDTGDPRLGATADVHAQGGVVALTHPFGLSTSLDTEIDAAATVAASCANLLEHAAYGVDLVEVGYPSRVLDLADHLQLWDCTSLGGLRLVGIGTSDLHNAVAWEDWRNNFVTWVWAEAAERGSLVEALGARRAFFGDPTRVRSSVVRLDLRSDGSSVMGQVLSTDEAHTIEVRLSGVGREGLTGRWVLDGVAQDGHDAAFIPPLTVEAGHTFARYEVWDGDDGVLFSNPVWFVE